MYLTDMYRITISGFSHYQLTDFCRHTLDLFFSKAHQSLVDLENSRDDLLFELHRIGHQNSRDREGLTRTSIKKNLLID
jgi:hypothetical protein